MSRSAAAIEAARLRFRPILMTSLAFILGVMPLAFSTGAGAGARNSVGTGVMGGMLAATFLAIFFVPCSSAAGGPPPEREAQHRRVAQGGTRCARAGHARAASLEGSLEEWADPIPGLPIMTDFPNPPPLPAIPQRPAGPHIPDSVLDRLARCSSGSLTTQLYIKGFRQPVLHGLRPLNRTVKPFAGRAYTMRFIPAREDVDMYSNLTTEPSANNLQWVGVEQIEPGHVLVIDSNRRRPRRVDGQHADHADDDARRAWRGHRRELSRRHRTGPHGLPHLVHRRHRHHAAGVPSRGRPAGAVSVARAWPCTRAT